MAYPQWCRFALMKHKPWHGNVLELWNKHSDVDFEKVEDVPSEIFIKAWETFAENEGLDRNF